MSFPIEMDVFPTGFTRTVKPLHLSERVDPYLSYANQGKVEAFVSYQEKKHYRIFNQKMKPDWTKKTLVMANFRRNIEKSREANFFDPNSVHWERIGKKLQLNPKRRLKYSDSRLGYKLGNLFIVKVFFTFGQRPVELGFKHVYQTSDAPMLCYVLPAGNTEASRTRRNFRPYDEMYYDRYVFKPHGTYTVPPGTRYVILTVQKTIFSLKIVPEDLEIADAEDCRSLKKYNLDEYRLPPPTPAIELDPASPPPPVPEFVTPPVPEFVPTPEFPPEPLPESVPTSEFVIPEDYVPPPPEFATHEFVLPEPPVDISLEPGQIIYFEAMDFTQDQDQKFLDELNELEKSFSEKTICYEICPTCNRKL